MYLFASRNSAPDVPRRSAAFNIVGLWILPLGLLAAWLVAGGFTLVSLASAAAAWRTRPPAAETVREEVRIAMPVAAPVVPATRRCRLARPGGGPPEHVL